MRFFEIYSCRKRDDELFLLIFSAALLVVMWSIVFPAEVLLAAACAAAPLPQPSAGSEPLGSIERIRAANLSSSRWRAAAAALPPT